MSQIQNLKKEFVQSGIWRLLLVYMINVASAGMLVSYIPIIMANFFASQESGGVVTDCSGVGGEENSSTCRDAYAEVTIWSSWSQFVQSSILALILTPLIGTQADIHGRKPFIILALALGCLCSLVLSIWAFFGVGLFWYYPIFSFAGGAINTSALCLAYLADVISPEQRLLAFGAFLGVMQLAITFAPGIGSLLGMRTAIYTAFTLNVLASFLAIVLMKESVSDTAKQRAREEYEKDRNCVLKLFASLRMILQRKLFIQLTLCNMLLAFSQYGFYTVALQYLQLMFGFTPGDFGIFFFIVGFSGLVAQILFLPILQKLVGEKWLLVIGLLAQAVQFVGLSAIRTVWQVYLIFVISSISAFIFPAVSGIKANNVEEHQQGAIQGALYGATGLAQGLGPVIFAQIYSQFTSSKSVLPYCPQAVLVFGGFVVLLALIVTLTIDEKEARNKIGDNKVYMALDSDDLLDEYNNKHKLDGKKQQSYGRDDLRESLECEEVLLSNE
eukprot:TRINITY_DN3995_c2_g3_i5.p1 TRINITY_DN3995_c2_g3~~TRINITY_DN3995_c2_g3_i5.p1  ORF type:complete len:500 (-),score=54.71 TRINITY_DN3995_c2_g3_i5:622-2121(-)